MKVSAIVAIDKNYAIGQNNQIPWYLPADLKYFKKTTIHHHVIMGRKTFESIGRPLPKRTNIVITRNPFYVATDAIVLHSMEEALQFAKEGGEKEAFIIGGGIIYEAAFPLLDRIYITEVETEVEAPEVFFPKFDPTEWNLISESHHLADEKNEFNYTIKIFEK